jgi:hypothetical protein
VCVIRFRVYVHCTVCRLANLAFCSRVEVVIIAEATRIDELVAGRLFLVVVPPEIMQNGIPSHSLGELVSVQPKHWRSDSY